MMFRQKGGFRFCAAPAPPLPVVAGPGFHHAWTAEYLLFHMYLAIRYEMRTCFDVSRMRLAGPRARWIMGLASDGRAESTWEGGSAWSRIIAGHAKLA